MRKIIVSEFYTLDGLMSDTQDQMDWVLGIFSEDVGQYEDGLYDRMDTLLLGRVTYKIFESYWPQAATNPSTPKGDLEMAHKMNNLTKIVFSKTLPKVEWKNSRLMKEINPDEIRKMKQQKGKDLLIVGSASLAQQFTNLGLIDECHLLVHPVVLGSGKPLFKDLKDRHKLKLINSKTFNNGVVLLHYEPDRKAKEAS